MKRIIIVTLLFLLAQLLHAQVVNVESKRIQTDTLGWSGSISTSFELTQNTTQIIDGAFDGSVQYKRKKSINLFLAKYEILKESGDNYKNALMFHLRNAQKLTKKISLESFVQFQRDEPLKIKKRILLGTGPRFKLVKTKPFRAYLGVLFMYEYDEDEIRPVVYHRDFRNSSYFSFTLSPTSYLSWMSTTFYQPCLNLISDYRILNQQSLLFKVTDNLSVVCDFDYLFDSTPIQGVPKSAYELNFGIRYIFK